MKRIRAKLTKRLIDSLEPVPAGTPFYVVTDTEDEGLRLRVLASGRKRFGFEYYASGRARWHTFGTFGPMTVEAARTNARALRSDVEAGRDPVDAKAKERAEPSFEEYADRWVKRAKSRKKPTSLRNDELLLRLYLVPALGKKKLRDIKRGDLLRLRDMPPEEWKRLRGNPVVEEKPGDKRGRKRRPREVTLADKPTTANRIFALASAVLNAAEADEERDPNTNPCRHLERYKERRLERALADEEFANLWKALDQSDEAPAAVAAIRLLALTGLRCGEVLALRWDDVDTEGARLQLRDSKTGARRVLLSPAAAGLLSSLPRDGAFVFPGKDRKPPGEGKNPLADLTHPWQRIRETAKLPDVRLHDLRHSFASAGIASGLSLPEIGKLLGHRSVATTSRYAHLIETAERRATDRVGAAIAKAIKTPRLRRVK